MTTNPQTTGGEVPEDTDSEAQRLPRSVRVTLRTISRLQGGYRQDVPAAVAAVARLRREASRSAHSSPGAWGLDHLRVLAELREKDQQAELVRQEGRGAPAQYFSSRSRAAHEQYEAHEDQAVHLAVTLWALHQQSLREDAMHLKGWPLGRSVRRLALAKTGSGESAGSGSQQTEEMSETVRKRFVRIGAADDIEVLGARLREMVILLRGARIPLDYGLLVKQIEDWQYEARRDRVRGDWGRSLHASYAGPLRTDDGDTGRTPPAEDHGDPDDDMGD
ncbi:type I-E CRISPR-associated protein Cse2/CasB [Streptomyces sp. CBMA152]|uniref:type I-E CRISPR-associated protein Cse2/CasB n=1 Tax=Streptomyces sp. CBMA152 TaxID=1896312 RepID=UPI0016612590|nr:type I-E CRISPR-associated protein Cse2/CasB [Streptomyces sp. CBMA152]MBD0746011.1 type I-E CRISPR-associated protein Cse2/CasB [Streptomyces sp. CBMA152]